jgi:YVTN family beta-propeller protein
VNTPARFRRPQLLTGLACILLVAAQAFADTVYVVNEVSEDITVIDTDSQAVVTTIAGLLSPVGISPAADGSEVYVASYLDFVGDDGVRIYDTDTNAEIGRVNTGVGFNTLQVVASADGTRLYATNENADTVSVIDRATLQVVDSYAVGSGPIGIDLTPDGRRLLVSNASDDSVSILNAQTGDVEATLPVGALPNQVIVHPSGLTAYTTDITGESVSVLYLPVPAVIATVPVAGQPLALAIAPDGEEAWVVTSGTDNVQVVDLQRNTIVDTVAVGSAPLGVRFAAEGGTALVTNAGGNSLSVIDRESRAVVGTIAVGLNPSDLAVVPRVTVGGKTTGLSNQFALCQNRTTGQTAVIALFGAPTWDCEGAGLLVSPGDSVQQIVRGTVAQ